MVKQLYRLLRTYKIALLIRILASSQDFHILRVGSFVRDYCLWTSLKVRVRERSSLVAYPSPEDKYFFET